MPITPNQSVKTLTAAGTSEQLETDTAIQPSSVYFEASRANTGVIYIGVSTVSSLIYIGALSAGESLTIDADYEGYSKQNGGNLQLSDLWFDADVSGEIVMQTYMHRKQGNN